MSRVNLPPSAWLEDGLSRTGLSQAEVVRQMRARGIKITEPELSRWKTARYTRSPKVRAVYRFLFEGTEKDPSPEGGADEVLAELRELRSELRAAREDAVSDREALAKMLAGLGDSIEALRGSADTGAGVVDRTTDRPTSASGSID